MLNRQKGCASFRKVGMALLLVCVLCFTTACEDDSDAGGSSSKKSGSRTTVTSIRMPEALGTTVYSNDSGTIVIDASDIAHGYLMVKYTGDADKVQLQVTDPQGERTPYPIQTGDYHGIPFTAGDGQYQVSVLEHVKDTTYSVGLTVDLTVALESELDPFLYPNQYCEYNESSASVKKGMELSGNASDDLDYIEEVYNFVIETISYDEEFASNISVNYIPNPDDTLASKKGICLDYASLTTALLRSQGLPTKLEVGYSGSVYHAWISVWTEETGWIDRVIRFDGNEWTLIDPTLAANNDASSVKEYVGDGSNYTLEFVY